MLLRPYCVGIRDCGTNFKTLNKFIFLPLTVCTFTTQNTMIM
uniref:Uncharacterized protein n=1 Tax=Picea sitchensis TaxID=3332 RepID=B8LPC0_PICSI|nr:unknown [Picea sitchensis]